MTISFKEVQPQKHQSPRLATLFGITIEVKEVQHWKQA